MHYTRVLKYVRTGDFVVAMYKSRAHGYTTISPVVPWSTLYGGHTEWIDRDIKERANAPRRRYA